MKTPNKYLLFVIVAFAAIISAFSQPTDNVVAYYPFNGNANDVSGNAKNPTVTGATLTTDRLGKANAAYYFNGSSNLMKLPNAMLPNSSAFTISVWIKPIGNHFSTDMNSQTIVDLRGQYQIALSYNQPSNPTNPNSVQFYIYSNPTAIMVTSANNSIQLNAWSHVVACYASNAMKLYINGNLVGTGTSNAASAVSGYNNTIGKDYAVSNNRGWVYGSIDEVLFYKRSLTSTEVLALYNRELVSSEIPELYSNPPLQYTYDAIGRRTSRNAIVLKSASFIATPDSAGLIQSIDENKLGDAFEETVGDQKVVIYPNPTQGQMLVEIQGYEKETNSALYLFDLSGKLLISKKPANNTMPLDLTSFPLGTYVLKIVLGDKTSEWKIIKE